MNGMKERITTAIRDVPDFPKPGILFKDITPVLANPDLFKGAVDLFAEGLAGRNVTRIAAVDARGFMFGGALCERLGLGFVPIRKKGKLPYTVHEESYDLEYGSATLSLHIDAFETGENVALVDDLLATGGTAAASCKLIEKAGGNVAAVLFLIELAFLEGRKKLEGYHVRAPIVYCD